MPLITLSVKGSMQEAQAELTRRNIVFKFGRAFDMTQFGIPLAQFLLDGRFNIAVTEWFSERGALPYPAGSVLLFRFHDSDEAVATALADFSIAPFVGTDFTGLPELTHRQARELCKNPGAVAFDDQWIVRNRLTGEVIQGDRNEQRAKESVRTLNDHEVSKNRSSVFVADKLT